MSGASPLPAAPSALARPSVRRAATAGAGLLLAGGLLLTGAGPAAAHVRVVPDTTSPGGYALLTFRVPNEDPKARTTEVELTMPTTDPFASVSTQPLPGWTTTVTEAPLPTPVTDDDGTTLTKAPHTVTWTAQAGQGIGADQFQQFVASVGPLPESGTVLIPATQTYSDGTVVHWDQPTPASGAEPEHPAPAFTIGTSTAGDTGPATGSATPTAAGGAGAAQAAGPVTAPAGADHTARWLAVIGLVVGLLGLGVGGLGLAGRRGRATSPRA